MSVEALQIAVKRREEKGEMERYTYLNAEFQRITRKDKKAFLSDQCKEIEENNRMGKTRELLKHKASHSSSTSILGFPASSSVRNKRLLLKPLCLWHSVIATQADGDGILEL